jgi:hypothetical protein
MPSRSDPWDIPEARALMREAALVRHLLGSGATALGRASHGDKLGEYYTGFFGLSVGLERLAKLIMVTDHVIVHDGRMPEQKFVEKISTT